MRKAGKPKNEGGETNMNQDSLNELEAAMLKETTKVSTCSGSDGKAYLSSRRCLFQADGRSLDVLFSSR